MINLIKFIHMLCTLSLLGGTLYCFVHTAKTRSLATSTMHRTILYIGTFALLTGTLLVYPKHFTFHTPWIQAAYILVVSYLSIIGLMSRYRGKLIFKYHGIILTIYFSLIVLLVLVIHDAVTKTTILLS